MIEDETIFDWRETYGIISVLLRAVESEFENQMDLTQDGCYKLTKLK